MSELTRELFNRGKTEREDAETIKVLISLNIPASEVCLEQIQAIGLKEISVMGNKLIGEIEYGQIEALQAHDSVNEVERSVELKPNYE